MRTTLSIDDDILRAARSLATSQGKSVGKVVSELARKGLKPDVSAASPDGFPTFKVAPGTPVMTPEMVREALDDGL